MQMRCMHSVSSMVFVASSVSLNALSVASTVTAAQCVPQCFLRCKQCCMQCSHISTDFPPLPRAAPGRLHLLQGINAEHKKGSIMHPPPHHP
eukprot:1161898-Pelagomonas_calceolata.AAC.3